MSMLVYITEIIRITTGFLFLAGAIGKLRHYSDFTSNLTSSFHVSPSLSRLLAPSLIILEAMLAMIVLSNTTKTPQAMYAALLLLLFFTVIITYRYLSESSVKCSCFGEASRPVSIYDLCRNLIVISLLTFYHFAASSMLDTDLKTIALLGASAFLLTMLLIYFHDTMILLLHTADGQL